MITKLKAILARDGRGSGGASARGKVRKPAIPSGERVYAIGDVHGRLDLFDKLIEAIEADDAARPSAHTTVVLLGDLIDRGPDSAGVLARAREWAGRRHVEILQGNHEEMFLVGRTRLSAFTNFLKFGGRETLLSYGVDPEAMARNDAAELQQRLLAAVPPTDFDFVDGFEKLIRIGDYLFVHAGIRPSTPLDMQAGQDCRWIREPFLSDTRDHGAVVVHGHTVTEEPVIRSNRIGIDTGAFRSGTLTAIGLQGTDRWLLQARQPESGMIETIALGV